MRILLFLSILPVVLSCLGPALADPQDPYYVLVAPHNPELPAEREPSYDCAGEGGPKGVSQTILYDVDGLTDGTRWGLPYVAPSCLAVDGRTEVPEIPPLGAPDSSRGCGSLKGGWAVRAHSGWELCRFSYAGHRLGASEEVSVRATYNLSSGRYFVHVAPSLTMARVLTWSTTFMGVPPDLSGDSGVSVLFDCVECPPPWE